MNNNWKNPWYWVVLLAAGTAVTVGTKYLSEKIEIELKKNDLWPDSESK
jgi:hypothetical protein